MLRLLFYILMGMVGWSFNTLLGKLSCVVLLVIALFNTYVLYRYPGYRNTMKEISDEEKKLLKGGLRTEARKQAWRHVTLPWWIDSDA